MIYEQIMKILRKSVIEHGSIGNLARMVEIPKSSLARWVAGTSVPPVDVVGRILDYLGYRIVKNESSYNDERPEKNFISVPIIKNPSLLRSGFIPADNICGWCAVEHNFPSVANRSDLIVIPVKDSVMEPSLPNGSLILVDRGDTSIRNGCIYLVRTPQGCTILRRVSITGRRIAFGHDNPKVFTECHTYDVIKDYEGDLSMAIVGRAIWMRCKITEI